MPRINIGAKPYIMPMPVLILSSYDAEEKPCAMLAVWGGISNEKEITITVAAQRHTLKGILARQPLLSAWPTQSTKPPATILASRQAAK